MVAIEAAPKSTGKQMSETNTISIVSKLLQDLGYKAEMLGDDSVGSAASGFKFVIQAYGTSVQFHCGIGIDAEEREWLDFANKFNTDLRFVKAYLADDETIAVEGDWWFDAQDENPSNRFQMMLELWEMGLAEMKQRLREDRSTSSADQKEES
jgi:hypothetical protein